MTTFNQEALQDRAEKLGAYNGMELALVTLPAGPDPAYAMLDVTFFNKQHLQAMINFAQKPENDLNDLLLISGGQRLVGGPLSGQVQVTEVTGDVPHNKLHLKIAPVGDYSTYTLSIVDYVTYKIDPLFSEIKFKFRPGCFNVDCAPDWKAPQPPTKQPIIDYLNKDYESFRHMLIAAMKDRVSGWEATSEADLDMTLLELMSVKADELSDYQDRIMNEAYLNTARKRISLARHARLMDYHIFQGQQAQTVVAAQLAEGQQLEILENDEGRPDQTIVFWTGSAETDHDSEYFISKDTVFMDALLNEMKLYPWQGVKPSLPCGSTSADLQVPANSKANALKIVNWINEGKIPTLLIQENLNPHTGGESGVHPEKRQLLRLKKTAQYVFDPIGDEVVHLVRVQWKKQDALQWNYSIYEQFGLAEPVDNLSLVYGNMITAYHGQLKTVTFKPRDQILESRDDYYYEETKWGTICTFDHLDRLAYQVTEAVNELPGYSTAQVEILTGDADNVIRNRWDEQISLVQSTEEDEHFIVETDENSRSHLRFGNGTNGKAIPEQAVVQCTVQVGLPLNGNVGRDKINHANDAVFIACWNPFDVTGGKVAEPTGEIIRRVQEAYLHKQLRAITLEDYENRALELSTVSNAKATYKWTGSWRAIRIAIDPIGGYDEQELIRQKVARHLEPVKLIGDDLEVRLPHFVPAAITISLCIHPDFWADDIRFLLDQEFSTGYTQDGRKAFFHPDCWTFGQTLYASQILGRIEKITGISHVRTIEMKRFNEVTPGTPDRIEMEIHEVLQVENDPDHQEKGTINFDIKGGRH